MTSTPLPYSYNKGKQQGSVFIFDKDVIESDDDTEVFQMKSIRSRGKLNKEDGAPSKPEKEAQETISHELSPTDTLQALAIKYHCKVSDIKRINHMWNANELSARDNVLIPIAKHSFLLDSRPCPPAQIKREPPPDTANVDIRTISIKRLGDSADTQMFLDRMNRDIETLLKETRDKTRKASLSEVKTALTVERIFPEQVSSSGTGLSYFTIGVISIGFCFVFIGLPITLVYWDVVLERINEVGKT